MKKVNRYSELKFGKYVGNMGTGTTLRCAPTYGEKDQLWWDLSSKPHLQKARRDRKANCYFGRLEKIPTTEGAELTKVSRAKSC